MKHFSPAKKKIRLLFLFALPSFFVCLFFFFFLFFLLSVRVGRYPVSFLPPPIRYLREPKARAEISCWSLESLEKRRLGKEDRVILIVIAQLFFEKGVESGDGRAGYEGRVSIF